MRAFPMPTATLNGGGQLQGPGVMPGAANLQATDPSVSRSELFELNALHVHQDDQALELGALDVIAGSGVEIRGYGERGSDESRQIRSKV